MKVVPILDQNGNLDREFAIGDVVAHFKGNLCIIEGFAVHTETQEELVLYRSTLDGKMWARPVEEFFGLVDGNKHPDLYGKECVRFAKVKVVPDDELGEDNASKE